MKRSGGKEEKDKKVIKKKKMNEKKIKLIFFIVIIHVIGSQLKGYRAALQWLPKVLSATLQEPIRQSCSVLMTRKTLADTKLHCLTMANFRAITRKETHWVEAGGKEE